MTINSPRNKSYPQTQRLRTKSFLTFTSFYPSVSSNSPCNKSVGGFGQKLFQTPLFIIPPPTLNQNGKIL